MFHELHVQDLRYTRQSHAALEQQYIAELLSPVVGRYEETIEDIGGAGTAAAGVVSSTETTTVTVGTAVLVRSASNGGEAPIVSVQQVNEKQKSFASVAQVCDFHTDLPFITECAVSFIIIVDPKQARRFSKSWKCFQ